ncbi:MAG: alpha-ketoacid dehydrogenase subunit beta [Planctomycetes bacterium]|nr:alpha-ketoacid dehydrogenase subunit beta [Planctomycetota bacterium]
MAKITYLQAISEGLREEMRRDETVFCLGEDIATYGGAFKVTDGFIEEFGSERMRDTPISEEGFSGLATGAAMMGFRPVVEFQFMDFLSNAMTMITQMTSTSYYRYGMKTPIVFRGPAGGYVHGGPFHSQNREAWFCHTPGLKVVYPSMAEDAKGLIKSSIRDNNPVLFFEHKYLYRRIKAEMPAGDHIVPLGKANVVLGGSDLTIVTYGAQVHMSLDAAKELEKDGISVEIIDLRTLVPLDEETIYESVRKTNRCLVLNEAHLTCGFASEVAARIGEFAFEHLDAPVRRLTGLDTPVPFSPPLEEFYMPQVSDIVELVRAQVSY